MDRKYELLKDNYINYEGKILYRIRALRDFSNVKAGDVGGYVQSEDNLSHKGDCWVYYNAKVFNNAKIHDNARIYGNAQIYGDAEVFGGARIYGNAKVYDEAEVFGNTTINNGDIIGKVSIPYKKIFQHQCCKRVLTAILTEDNKILYSIGCQENLTKEEFIDRIHNEDGGLEKNPYREEYLRLIPAIEAYFKGE